jgi:transcriptional regulator with PAS, ATPase and Fis domain
MTGSVIFTGHAGPLTADECSSIQRIADALTGLGMESVRLSDLEYAAIHVALTKTAQNRTHAARLLGISVRTLQRKLRANAIADLSPNDGHTVVERMVISDTLSD